MNSDEVEAAVAAYLAAGADGDVAGHTCDPNTCPVARGSGGFVGDEQCYVQFRRHPHAPTVRRFVALVDAEPGPTVTFARARALWQRAKEG